MKRLLFLFISSLAFASEVTVFEKKNIAYNDSLGDLSLLKKDNDFYVEKDGIEKLVKRHDIDPLLIKAKKNQLKTFLEEGRIEIKQLSNDDYLLRAKGRIKGGGPILAAVGYWTVKAFGYGVPAAVAAVTVTSAGTVIVPALAVGAAGGAAGGATATTIALTGAAVSAAAPATATVGAVVAGQAVIGAVGVQGAAIATGGVIAATGGSVAAYVAGVESAAAATSLALLAIPFL